MDCSLVSSEASTGCSTSTYANTAITETVPIFGVLISHSIRQGSGTGEVMRGGIQHRTSVVQPWIRHEDTRLELLPLASVLGKMSFREGHHVDEAEHFLFCLVPLNPVHPTGGPSEFYSVFDLVNLVPMVLYERERIVSDA